MKLYAALLLCLAGPVWADDCQDKIAGMFDGGPLDPFERPSHSYVNTVTGPEGAEKYVFEVWWDTPARGISGIRGGALYTLMIGSDAWTGPGPEGPWTKTPDSLPNDMEATQRQQIAQNIANLAQTECLGLTDMAGQSYDTVKFFTKTDPVEATGGAWFGGLNTVYIDPTSNLVMRWEMTDFVNSFSQGVTQDLHVQIFSYDSPRQIIRPD